MAASKASPGERAPRTGSEFEPGVKCEQDTAKSLPEQKSSQAGPTRPAPEVGRAAGKKPVQDGEPERTPQAEPRGVVG